MKRVVTMIQPRERKLKKRLKVSANVGHLSNTLLTAANSFSGTVSASYTTKMTSAEKLKVYEFDNGVIVCQLGKTLFPIPSVSIDDKAAIVLADAVLRALGLSEPVLELIRTYHVEPLARKATKKYRSAVD